MSLNNHGGIGDIFIFMIMAIALTIMAGVIAFVLISIDPKLEEGFGGIREDATDMNGTEIYETAIEPATSGNGAIISVYKWGITAIIITMALSIIIGGFLISVNPLYFIPYIIVMIIATIVSFPLANMYERIYTDSSLSTALSGFWSESFILLNLPYWVISIMAVAGMVMFINYVRKDGAGGNSAW